MIVAERRTKKRNRSTKLTGGMAIRIAGRLDIPDWVRDHESFRRWARSPDCPEVARVAFYDGDLWVDPDMEQIYFHNRVVVRIAGVLDSLVESEELGTYIGDGVLLTHPDVKLSTVPDGCFFSFLAVESGRIREVPGSKSGHVELEGSPEMVLEVVSDPSETKDLIDLRELYWKAGIDEYWIVDARTEVTRFEILKRNPKGYSSTRKQPEGWLRSEVFGRLFRLTSRLNRLGRPVYTLEVRKVGQGL
jgi:Uncharacterized protein conserved in cyanobacteria